MAQFLQTLLGSSPLEAGLQLLPWTATPMLVAPAAGALADRAGPRPVLATGLALQAIGLGWIALVAGAGTAYGELVVPLVVAGVGISMAIPSAQTAVLGAVAPDALGRATGVNSTLREMGGVLGIALTVAVFAARGDVGSAAAFADGFAPGIALAASLSLLTALLVPSRPAPVATEAPAPAPA